MPSIALITEGITDQVILEAILTSHYEDIENEIDINILQPLRDATDDSRQENFGGWEKVIEYCTIESLDDVLQYNDLIIIHLDTDVHSHANFKAEIFDGGQLLPIPTVIDRVASFIESTISHQILEKFGDKILFAIAVHSIECWILPFHAKARNAKKKITGCEGALQRVIPEKLGKYEKKYAFYKKICAIIKGKASIQAAAKENESLNIFINSLPALL